MSTSTNTPFQCKICSSNTMNSFYGVKSCEPCRVFFKRNVSNQTKLKCDFDGQCEITIHNRHVCAACRLKKCFEVGMCPELIRAQLGKRKKSLTGLTQRNIQPKQFPTLNLLERDQSLLTTNEWTRISNLIHSYDEHSSITVIRNYTKEIDSLPVKLRFKLNPEKIFQISTTFYQAAEEFLRVNQDFALLPSNDRSVVLHGAVDNLSCLGSGLLLRESGLITRSAYRYGLEKVYGTVPCNLTMDIVSALDQDLSLVKLTLALSAFCMSHCTSFDRKDPLIYIENSPAVLRIQNLYAELIWKYLLYRHSLEQAIQRFTHLIQCLIMSITMRTHLQSHHEHTNSVVSTVQKIEQLQHMIITDN